eukprot:s777_g29.t1
MAVVGRSELLDVFRVHLLEVPAGIEDVDGSSLALCLVVLRRQAGALLAIPTGIIHADVLAQGLVAESEDQVGQSIQLLVAAGTITDLELVEQPQEQDGALVEVLLVDVTASLGDTLMPYEPVAHPIELAGLRLGERSILRQPCGFLPDEGDAVPETPVAQLKRAAKARAATPNGGGPSGGGGGAPDAMKRGRVTVASLASSLEKVSGALPSIVQQLENLAERTAAVESQMLRDTSRPSALQQPLSSSITTGFGQSSVNPAELLKQMPPQKSTTLAGASHLSKPQPYVPEAMMLAEEKGLEMEQGDLARAMLAQSQAMAALVSQLTGSDPTHELTTPGLTLSSKGLSSSLGGMPLGRAALDGGRMDIGLLLSLSEDPPAGVFQNRSVTNYAKGRAFAPLAEQKWVTIVLSYIKEMDLIATKRSDATGSKPDKDAPAGQPSPKKVPKKKPKGGGKQANQQKEEED